MGSLHIDPAEVTDRICTFLRAEETVLRREGAVLGLSGGIDSAVVAALAVRALGPHKVTALMMPERDSSPDSEADARLVIGHLGIGCRKVDLTPLVSALGIYHAVPLQYLIGRNLKAAVVRQQHERMVAEVGTRPMMTGMLGTSGAAHQRTLDAGHAYARAKHRMRMVTLYYYAEMGNHLVLGTTNRSEAMTGYVVKWGDNVADVEPILPLYKTQVRQLAAYLDVPQRIIDKAPTADLLPGITDEYALGMTYEVLDQVLAALERRPVADVARDLAIAPEQVQFVAELTRASAHMRHLPPAPELDHAGGGAEPPTDAT